MEIRNERTDVSQRIGVPVGLPVLLHVFDVPAGSRVPLAHVAFVDAVDLPARWGSDVFVRQQELAETGIECKSVHAVSGRIHHHRAGSIDEVAGSDLIARLAAGNPEGIRRPCFL